MSLTTIFQISVLAATALSATMLSFGEGSPFAAGITILACVATHLFKDRWGLVRINNLWGNVLGAVAVCLVAFEFFTPTLEARLLAGAHFLSYLTWIVLFQDKTFRQYWWLLALGMLQVAVGAVLTDSGWYGVMLLAYLLLAVWTMSIFNLYRGATIFGAAGPAPLPVAPYRKPALVHAAAAAMHPAESSLASLFDPRSRSQVHGTVQQDLPGRWVSERFVVGIVGISVAGLAIGVLMFLLVPRIPQKSAGRLLQRSAIAAGMRTGFSGEVRLGEMGRILENNERVMRVHLRDMNTRRTMRLEEFCALYGLEEPLFRGNVLRYYENARWFHRRGRKLSREDDSSFPDGPFPQSTGPRYVELDNNKDPRHRDRNLIAQEYHIDFADSPLLFAMRPADRGVFAGGETIWVQERTGMLTSQADSHEKIDYTIWSVRPGNELGVGVSAARPFADLEVVDDAGEIDSSCLQLPEQGLERLKSLAQQIADSEPPEMSPGVPATARRARRIESWLRDSGEFTYSLNMSVDDPDIDPVEDFLFNRRTGHCEYFASALALMLRAVEIPSRVVTGFKGADTFASNSGFYDVMNRHAHAWVEAAIEGDWVVLDATPPARDASVRQVASTQSVWRSARQQLSSLWTNYIISMSSSRQRENLYEPLWASLKGSFQSLRGSLQHAGHLALWLRFEKPNPEKPFSGGDFWRIIGLLVALAAAWKFVPAAMRPAQARRRMFASPALLRWAPRWLRRLWLDPAATGFVVEFYQKFIELTSARGLVQASTQTPREFARHVEATLEDLLAGAGLSTLPSELTELYYRVRFGRQSLVAAEADVLDSRLRRLEEHLRQSA